MTETAQEISFEVSYTFVTPNGAVLRSYTQEMATTPDEAIDAHISRCKGSHGLLSIGASAFGSGRGSVTRTFGKKAWSDTLARWTVKP